MNPGHGFLASLAVSSLLVLSAACGDDDGSGTDGDPADAAANADASGGEPDGGGGEADAMPADLGCIGDPLPTEAANPVTVSGGVIEIDLGGQSAVQGAIVEFRRASTDRVLDDNAPGGTPADGSYSLSGRTRGNPLMAYLHSSADELTSTRLYPPLPLTADLGMIPIPMFTPVILEFLSPDQEPDNGIVLVIVLDCSGMPIMGATVSSTPEAGEVVYAGDNGAPDPAATGTGAQGLAYLLNVPPGTVTVDASANDMALFGHDVGSVGGELTTTIILPGPPSL